MKVLGKKAAAPKLIAEKLYTTGKRNQRRVFHIEMVKTKQIIKPINEATFNRLIFCPLGLKMKSLMSQPCMPRANRAKVKTSLMLIPERCTSPGTIVQVAAKYKMTAKIESMFSI